MSGHPKMPIQSSRVILRTSSPSTFSFPRFRGALGVSGKTALVVTPTAFSFWTQSHLTVGNATKDPSSYITAAKTPVVSTATPGTAVKLPAWYGVANVLYEHPFKTIIGIAAPIYAGLFYRESTHEATRTEWSWRRRPFAERRA